jgi:hypothetical protein
VGGPCTLVDAITAANTDTATGGCPAGIGADTIVLPAGSTQTLNRVHNDTYGPTGLPVIRSVITIAGQGSMIARAEEAPDFRLLAVHSMGDLTLQETTVSGAVTAFRRHGGGVANSGGTLTVTHSTITGNSADRLGGGVTNFATLTLARTLVTGNTAPTGPEILNFDVGTVVAADHNLFGLDGTAGVEGFSPGPTDMVPPAGVLLPDILNPTLALHGGLTQTHALVPGSPAIDAGGPVCLDADGNPLTTDQRGKPRPVDGDGDGTAACDIGTFEFFPLVSDLVTLEPDLETAGDSTPVPGGPAGTFTITTTFTHTSETPLRVPFFEVTALSGGNVLLNADEGPAGVGATLTPEVGDGVLSPGETVTVDFVIGLQAQAPFTFEVELFGAPRPEGGPSLSRLQGTRPR